MIMGIQNLVSFCQFVLKILSKNLILTSIKGRNSVANLPKFELILIGLFVFKILSKNLILTSIKGRNSVANLPKFELIQAFMHVLVTCKNEEDTIKNEGARVFTRFLTL